MVAKVPTVGQYLWRWLDETVGPNLTPLTHATYESHVRHYLDPGLGSIRLDRLRVADVQRWLNGLPAQCQCCAQEKDARRLVSGKARCCAGRRRTCATFLVDLDVHPRVIMRILRHADQAVTMEIYARPAQRRPQEALRRLGESLW